MAHSGKASRNETSQHGQPAMSPVMERLGDLQVTEKKELPRKRFEGLPRPLLGRRKISSPELQSSQKAESTLALLNRKVSSPEIKISSVDNDNNETKLNEERAISEEQTEDLGIMFTAKNKNKLTVDLYQKSSSSCEDCSKETIDNSHSFDRLMSTASAPSSPSETVHLSRSWNSLAPTGTVSHSQVRKSDEFDCRDSTNGKNSKDTCSAKSKPKWRPIFTLFPRSSGEIKNKECTHTEQAPAHALFLKETFDPKKEDIPPKRLVTRVRSRSVGSEEDVIEEIDEASGSDSPNDDALQLPAFNAENEKRKKKKNLAKDMKERLRFLRRRHTDGCLKDAEKLKSHLKSTTHAQALKWSESFDNLLADKYGLASFRSFLKTEFSDENIEFWLACEEYKKLRPSKWSSRAQKIYNDYVAIQAPREVNLDSHSRMATISNLSNPTKHAFDLAQKRIQSLMEKDSYPRFIRSEFYQTLINDKQKVSSC
ncbi:uncharacterized protein [Ptychodera flava]|uniref:uncharacterized protein isoform X2 n=1 Tax=Ptychodera flava TaxID=63121 RepID=UPI003969F2E7